MPLSVVFLLILIAIIGYAAWWKHANSFVIRYKMTVVVETPEGTVSGSAVRQISNSVPLINLPDVGNPASVKGEAVVVNLGNRGSLFALVSHKSDNEFYSAFPLSGVKRGGGSSPEGIKYYASLPIGAINILNPTDWPGYPELVAFTDISDPKSVTFAQVWERRNDGFFELKDDRMEDIFGKGVYLKRITIEIANEPITCEIHKILPWLSEIGGGYLHGGKTSRGAPLGLHGGNFWRG